MGRLALAISIAAALALASTPARASSSYPAIIAAQPGATCAPDCTVCHATDSGGTGTVVQPFGRALVMLGLVAENPSSLLATLDAARSEGLDVGCDGVPDVDELFACRDPNTPGDGGGACGAGGASAYPIPQYGCTVAGSPRAPDSALPGACGAGVFLTLGALGLLGSRRRAATRARSASTEA
jgi:hypothetical protein